METTVMQRLRAYMLRKMFQVMPACKEISQLTSASMDKKQPLQKRLSIRLHLVMCHSCRRYKKQLHMLREAVIRYANPEYNVIEKSLSPEARERLEKVLAHRACR